ncbi:HNH endonuclease [Teredinibacter turnerae]|uniref:HNH endonuclease n=1 Tax=Teredinibacter turnerae TaxID=2426 RepID=UPI003BB00E39
MAAKPPYFCARCKCVHAGVCAAKPKHNWSQRKRSRSGRGGRPWERKRKAVFERDKYLCQKHLERGALVAVTLHGDDAGICDHKVPLSEGGTDDEDNLQTLCKECSGDKTKAESARGRGGSKVSG